MAPFPDTCTAVLPLSAQDYFVERDSAAFRALMSEVPAVTMCFDTRHLSKVFGSERQEQILDSGDIVLCSAKIWHCLWSVSRVRFCRSLTLARWSGLSHGQKERNAIINL